MKQMAALTTKTEESLADIDKIIQQLHVTWSGEAAAAQAEAHAEWAAGAEDMRDALSDLEKLGSTAKSNYDSAVDANVRMWRR
ncbi:hypothetical protein A5785_02540 [Gordonia sp. 852002-50395_SCH5434458]|nr:hypothetical protein A5785_02540 [Gordonia sp. 852002-50395_SCH5434458]